MRVPVSGFLLTAMVIVAAFIGYFYYESNLPGTLFLDVYALGNVSDDVFANSTILQVLVNFTEIQVHSAGQSNQTGWHVVMQARNPYPSDMTTYSCRIGYVCVSWESKLAPGSYDLVKINATNIRIDIKSVGNVSDALVGGGFEPLVSGFSSFIIQPNQDRSVPVHLTFSSAEVYARNGYLHAISEEELLY